MKRGFCIILYLFVFLIISCSEKNSKIKFEYYGKGKIKHIKRYNEKGNLNGQAQWFYPSGKIEQIVIFNDGKENGNAYYFYESGAIKNFRYWHNGKMVGYVCDYYNDNFGTIKSVLLFSDSGNLVYKKNFDSLGHFSCNS